MIVKIYFPPRKHIVLAIWVLRVVTTLSGGMGRSPQRKSLIQRLNRSRACELLPDIRWAAVIADFARAVDGSVE